MKTYPETIVVQQHRERRTRVKMGPAMELETILGVIDISRRKTTRQFIDYMGAMGRRHKTLRTYAFALRSLEKVNKPYTEITKEDLVSWIRGIELDDGLKPSSINSYKICIKPFFKWLYTGDIDGDEYPAVVKWMKIKKPRRNSDRHIPTRSVILKLVEAAECQRDRGMFFTLLESGARSEEFTTTRIRDYVFDRYGATVHVNGKTGDRPIRLVECVPDLQLWLSMHPFKNDPDAPMWVTTRQPYRAITQIGLDMCIRKYCRILRLGSSFGAHMFRHAQATEDAKHFPEPVLRAKYGWTKDSDMPSVYVHHSARDTDNVILAHYGIKVGEDAMAMNPARPKVCPRCKHSNSAMARFCMQCSAPLDAKAVMEIEAKTAQAEDITTQVMAELAKRVPDELAKIIDELGLRSKIEKVYNG